MPAKQSGSGKKAKATAAKTLAAPDPARLVRWILFIAVLGLVARAVLACISWGTSDTLGFLRFGFEIHQHGLLATYRTDPELNHPPLAAWWSWLSIVLSGKDAFRASLLIRLPAMLTDLGTAFLLWRIWNRPGPGAAVRAAGIVALYCWSPVALLISGYHGNTDSVYAFLCLLTCYLLQDPKRPLLAGLALGAAINVKLIPILIVPALIVWISCNGAEARAKSLSRFLIGLAVGVLPFLPPLLLGGPSFRHNVLAYRSRVDLWGVNFFLSLIHPPDPTGGLPLPAPIEAYRSIGRWLILLLVGCWCVAIARNCRRWSAYEVACVTLSIFLIFAPGFGVQYLVCVVPLLFAIHPRIALAYSIAGGTFLAAAYLVFWDGTFPMSSLFDRLFPPPIAILGLIPWCVLIFYVGKTIRRRTMAAE